MPVPATVTVAALLIGINAPVTLPFAGSCEIQDISMDAVVHLRCPASDQPAVADIWVYRERSVALTVRSVNPPLCLSLWDALNGTLGKPEGGFTRARWSTGPQDSAPWLWDVDLSPTGSGCTLRQSVNTPEGRLIIDALVEKEKKNQNENSAPKAGGAP